MFRPSFIGDGGGNLVDQRRIPGSRHANCLGKNGGYSGSTHPVQTLIPPIVFGHAEAFNSRGIKDHLGNLFIQRHPVDQIVNTFFNG